MDMDFPSGKIPNVGRTTYLLAFVSLTLNKTGESVILVAVRTSERKPSSSGQITLNFKARLSSLTSLIKGDSVDGEVKEELEGLRFDDCANGTDGAIGTGLRKTNGTDEFAES